MIREAQYKERVPFMVIIGEKEKSSGLISVRNRDTGKTENAVLEEFIEKALKLMDC